MEGGEQVFPGTPPGETEVFIGLGSNLGDPRANLEAGIRDLEGMAGFTRLGLSSLYRTAPVGMTEQGAFLNAVLRAGWRGSPRDLLEALLETERRRGRVRVVRWGPRSLDLDILLFGGMVIEESDLVVPHPELPGRAFVLVPLMELAPDRTLPRWNLTPRQMWERMPAEEKAGQTVERIPWDFGR